MSRGSLGRYIVCGCAIFLLAKEAKYRFKQQDYAGAAESGKDSKTNIVTRENVLVSPMVRTYTEEREYQKKSDKYSWVQPALLVFTGLAAIFAAWAASETSRQATAADEANRPWLYVEQVQSSYVSINEKSVLKARFEITADNLGHSVAYDVHVRAMLSPAPVNFVAEIENFCKSAGISDFVEEQNGRVVFPGKLTIFSGRTDPLQIDAKTNLNLVELRLCLYYRAENFGPELHTGMFFVFQDLPQKIPAEQRDVKLIQDFFAGTYAD